jgi:hypothetical protein
MGEQTGHLGSHLECHCIGELSVARGPMVALSTPGDIRKGSGAAHEWSEGVGVPPLRKPGSRHDSWGVAVTLVSNLLQGG